MPKILVVDDAIYVRSKSMKLLAENGFEVAEAANGAEAVSKYNEIKPDLVLMDITMPVMDGITAVKEIKKNDPGAKVIMCTALGQQSMVIEAIKAGAKDFIVKPYQTDRVLATVRKLVQAAG